MRAILWGIAGAAGAILIADGALAAPAEGPYGGSTRGMCRAMANTNPETTGQVKGNAVTVTIQWPSARVIATGKILPDGAVESTNSANLNGRFRGNSFSGTMELKTGTNPCSYSISLDKK